MFAIRVIRSAGKILLKSHLKISFGIETPGYHFSLVGFQITLWYKVENYSEEPSLINTDCDNPQRWSRARGSKYKIQRSMNFIVSKLLMRMHWESILITIKTAKIFSFKKYGIKIMLKNKINSTKYFCLIAGKWRVYSDWVRAMTEQYSSGFKEVYVQDI